jgi:hypothetical protein
MIRKLSLVTLASLAVGTAADAAKGSDTTVMIYRPEQPQGTTGTFALVTERRTFSMKNGDNQIKITDVAAQLDPTTVTVHDVTDPDAQVTEQSFDYDLGSIDKLLGRYVGQQITLVTEAGDIKGTLLTFDAAQLVVQTDDANSPVQIVERGKNLRDIRFGKLDGGLVTKPTLSWTLRTKKPGDHTVEITYQSYGVTWSADYTVVISSDDKRVDFSGWLTISNNSGGGWTDAVIKLVSGDVHHSVPVNPQAPQYDGDGNAIDPNNQPIKPQKVYAIPGNATIGAQAQKQIQLFPPSSAAGGHVYLYDYTAKYAGYYIKQNYPQMQPDIDGPQYQAKQINEVSEYLEVKNSDKNGMGTALPGGDVRVYRRADDGALTLMSDATIGATAKDGDIRVRIGTVQDISAERRQADFQVDEQHKEMHEKFEYKLHNKKKEAIEVVMTDLPYRWRNWRIENASVPSVNTDDGRATFRVKVPANGDATLTYTVTYYGWP